MSFFFPLFKKKMKSDRKTKMKVRLIEVIRLELVDYYFLELPVKTSRF